MSYERDSFEPLQPEALFDHAERLQELHAIDSAVAEEHRPQLYAMAQKIMASLVDPGRQQAVELYAGILDWQMFGRHGDDLPPGLLLAKNSNGADKITYNDDVPYISESMPSILIREFDKQGVTNLSDSVRPHVEKHRQEIDETFVEFLKQTPEYNLIAAFDEPEFRTEDQPLNPFWLQIRQTQVADALLIKYGLKTVSDITTGSSADRELKRRFHMLDEETTAQPIKDNDSLTGLMRARAYLKPYMEQAVIHYAGVRSSFDEVSIDEEDPSVVNVVYCREDDQEFTIELYEIATIAGGLLGESLYVGDQRMKYLAKRFDGMVIEEIFRPQTRSIQEALAEALQQSVDMFHDDTHDMFPKGSITNYPGDFSLILKDPQGPVSDKPLPDKMYLDKTWDGVFSAKAQLSTMNEIQRSQRVVKGYVEQYGPSHYRVAGRLILESLCEIPFEPTKEDPDLVITLFGFNESSPFIPGYKLISSGLWSTYSFEIDENGDQYARCDVPVSGDDMPRLVAAYRQIGMDRLAEQLEAKAGCAVDEFVRLIRDSSTYYIPTRLNTFYDDNPDPLMKRDRFVHDLTDFNGLVREGKLQVQCTGSAQFLKHSLNILFGAGSANVIDGLSLGANNTVISALGHAQTVFSHDGNQYILDATPPAELSGRGEYNDTASNTSQLDWHAARAPKVKQLTNKTTDTEQVPKFEITKEQKVAELLTSFQEQLKVALNMPDTDTLHSHLVTLRKHDPTRKVYEALYLSHLGQIDNDEVTDISKYVEECSYATHETRAKLGIDHYSQTFLSQLRSAMWRLGYIIGKN